jgi:L-methionine (R)-S-oxide reductase
MMLGATGHVFSNLANLSSLLWHAYATLPEPSQSVNWAGFYIREDYFPQSISKSIGVTSTSNKTTATEQGSSSLSSLLVLGPFHGKPACQQILFGRGVCGTAAVNKRTVIVPDVLEFPGHIACDADSRSEIVVPVLADGEVGAFFFFITVLLFAIFLFLFFSFFFPFLLSFF